MAYHIDAESVSLDELRKRIEATDLVPSRACLTDTIRERAKALVTHGITTLAALQGELKNPKRLGAVAKATGIDTQYLILLRREIEGYFPKPAPLRVFDWLPNKDIMQLERHGIGNTASLYDMTDSARKRSALAASTGVDTATLATIAALADVMRVQWVSPLFARMLLAAGYDSAAAIAGADPAALSASLSAVNAGKRFFKGTIGLRDISRLIQAARHVPGAVRQRRHPPKKKC